MDRCTELRVTDPNLDFWVDVRLRRFGRGWLAVADLAGTPEVGVGADAGLAVLLALWPLGPDVAWRMSVEPEVHPVRSRE